jgi:hypothetical protein
VLREENPRVVGAVGLKLMQLGQRAGSKVTHAVVKAEVIKGYAPAGYRSKCGLVFRFRPEEIIEDGEPTCRSCARVNRTTDANGFGFIIRVGRGRYQWNPRINPETLEPVSPEWELTEAGKRHRESRLKSREMERP